LEIDIMRSSYATYVGFQRKEEKLDYSGTTFLLSLKTYVGYVRRFMHIDLDYVRWREPHA